MGWLRPVAEFAIALVVIVVGTLAIADLDSRNTAFLGAVGAAALAFVWTLLAIRDRAFHGTNGDQINTEAAKIADDQDFKARENEWPRDRALIIVVWLIGFALMLVGLFGASPHPIPFVELRPESTCHPRPARDVVTPVSAFLTGLVTMRGASPAVLAITRTRRGVSGLVGLNGRLKALEDEVRVTTSESARAFTKTGQSQLKTKVSDLASRTCETLYTVVDLRSENPTACRVDPSQYACSCLPVLLVLPLPEDQDGQPDPGAWTQVRDRLVCFASLINIADEVVFLRGGARMPLRSDGLMNAIWMSASRLKIEDRDQHQAINTLAKRIAARRFNDLRDIVWRVATPETPLINAFGGAWNREQAPSALLVFDCIHDGLPLKALPFNQLAAELGRAYESAEVKPGRNGLGVA